MEQTLMGRCASATIWDSPRPTVRLPSVSPDICVHLRTSGRYMMPDCPDYNVHLRASAGICHMGRY